MFFTSSTSALISHWPAVPFVWGTVAKCYREGFIHKQMWRICLQCVTLPFLWAKCNVESESLAFALMSKVTNICTNVIQTSVILHQKHFALITPRQYFHSTGWWYDGISGNLVKFYLIILSVCWLSKSLSILSVFSLEKVRKYSAHINHSSGHLSNAWT